MITDGILVVFKEKGYTSHDVAAKLRRILNTRKTGHTGTLDPQAEGVLPVGVGRGTKLCDMLTNGDKEYVAELILGVCTDTEDMTGTVVADNKALAARLAVEDIIAAVMSFRGEYMQVPPMYSALKVQGKKLYELAREGKEVERAARPVNIREIEVLESGDARSGGECSGDDGRSVSVDASAARPWDGCRAVRLVEGYPVVKLRVACSKGTYIRTLCKDIGEKLGCGGAMLSLLRTEAAGFRIEEALRLSEIETLASEDKIANVIIPIDRVLSDYGRISVSPEGETLLKNGNPLFLRHIKGRSGWNDGERALVYDCSKTFCGVYEFEALKGRFKPFKMFL